MTRSELADALQPVQDAGINAIATAAATLLAQTLSGYRRMVRAHQEAILKQMVAEAWRIHDAGVAKERVRTGRPLGLQVMRGLH
jgi:hypothetical protein